MQKLGLVRDLPDEEYHKILPPEEAFYSSSQFKDAVEDIEHFHKKYVSREVSTAVGSQTQSNFDVGSLYHCMVLEPHKVKDTFVIFKGAVKRGKAYEEFVADNKDKIIVSQKQYDTAASIAKAAGENQSCQNLLAQGEPELSLFVELHGLRIKVRADFIDFERGFILDMKSTTGNPKNANDIQKKVSNLNYDLSAALYLDAFNEYCRLNDLPPIKHFMWCFDSKDKLTSKVWTCSEEMIKVGRAKYMQGLNAIRRAQKKGWAFPDENTMIGPATWDAQLWIGKDDKKAVEEIVDMEIIEQEGEDLL